MDCVSWIVFFLAIIVIFAFAYFLCDIWDFLLQGPLRKRQLMQLKKQKNKKTEKRGKKGSKNRQKESAKETSPHRP